MATGCGWLFLLLWSLLHGLAWQPGLMCLFKWPCAPEVSGSGCLPEIQVPIIHARYPYTNVPATIFDQVHSLRVIYQTTTPRCVLPSSSLPSRPLPPLSLLALWYVTIASIWTALQTILTSYRKLRLQVSLSSVLRLALPRLAVLLLPLLPSAPPPLSLWSQLLLPSLDPAAFPLPSPPFLLAAASRALPRLPRPQLPPRPHPSPPLPPGPAPPLPGPAPAARPPTLPCPWRPALLACPSWLVLHWLPSCKQIYRWSAAFVEYPLISRVSDPSGQSLNRAMHLSWNTNGLIFFTWLSRWNCHHGLLLPLVEMHQAAYIRLSSSWINTNIWSWFISRKLTCLDRETRRIWYKPHRDCCCHCRIINRPDLSAVDNC